MTRQLSVIVGVGAPELFHDDDDEGDGNDDDDSGNDGSGNDVNAEKAEA